MMSPPKRRIVSTISSQLVTTLAAVPDEVLPQGEGMQGDRRCVHVYVCVSFLLLIVSVVHGNAYR